MHVIMLLGDSSHGYYSVYCGMEVDSGSLVCIYEWMIPCKTQKKADTRRSRQVNNNNNNNNNIIIQLKGVVH